MGFANDDTRHYTNMCVYVCVLDCEFMWFADV